MCSSGCSPADETALTKNLKIPFTLIQEFLISCQGVHLFIIIQWQSTMKSCGLSWSGTPLSPTQRTETNISPANKNWSAKYYGLCFHRNEWKQFYAVRGTWGQTQRYCYSGGSHTTLAASHLEIPQMIYRACQLQGGAEGCRVASQLTWRGSHTDKSQFTQGAVTLREYVTLNDIFTGWLYSSFDNALATPFVSLKDEREAENVISSLRQGRQWLRIKREGGAS